MLAVSAISITVLVTQGKHAKVPREGATEGFIMKATGSYRKIQHYDSIG